MINAPGKIFCFASQQISQGKLLMTAKPNDPDEIFVSLHISFALRGKLMLNKFHEASSE